MTKKLPAWSHSNIKLFETCPRKFHAEKIEKLYPYRETEQTRYGNEVHKALELYVKDGQPLGKFQHHQPVVDALLKIKGEKLAEQKHTLNARLKPTGWFAKDAWLRGIADLLIINGKRAFVVDYKTGSDKYPDQDQLELMALLVFQHYPEVETVKAGLLFLRTNLFVKAVYNKKDRTAMWAKWGKRYKLYKLAHEKGNFPPKPNGFCRSWCPVEHCEYHGD